MSARLLKISPDKIRSGMYIEELDRPWLETPLKFQGFRVSNDETELGWIRHNCEYVLVDADRSEVEDITLETTQTLRTLNIRDPRLGPPQPRVEPGLARAWIERTDTRPVVDAPLKPAPTRRRWWNWLRRSDAIAAAPSASVVHGAFNRAEFNRQVLVAREHYGRATQILGDVMEKLRHGGELDVESMEQAIAPVIDCVLESTDAMACVIRLKEWDEYAYAHALATSIWSVVFGKSLGLDRASLQLLGKGGVLLDVGMTRVPRELIERDGALTQAERGCVARHVEHGLEILRSTGGLHPSVLQMVQTHHERHDGSGYPLGLQGNQIPLFGRIAGLVDTYDAMTSNRPGARAQSSFDVMRMLIAASDTLFQGELIDRFIRVVGVFPTASLVELNTGEVGIVVEQNAIRRLRPKVMLILDAGKQPRSEFSVCDLAQVSGDASEPGSLWIVNGLEPGAYGLDPREYYL